MVRSGNKFASALSWADEVELEEAAAQAQEHSMQRPNPFGSARPREVVLEEKGIDWKKIDHNVQQSSHLRQEPIVTMLHKHSISIASATINEKQSNLPKQKLEFPIPQNQSPIILVPPLRYPPKTVAGKPFEPEKENRFNEHDVRNFHNLETSCHSNPHFDQQALHRSESKQAQNNYKNLKKPVSHNSVGLSPKTKRRGSPQIHNKSSMPAGERHFRRDYTEDFIR